MLSSTAFTSPLNPFASSSFVFSSTFSWSLCIRKLFSKARLSALSSSESMSFSSGFFSAFFSSGVLTFTSFSSLGCSSTSFFFPFAATSSFPFSSFEARRKFPKFRARSSASPPLVFKLSFPKERLGFCWIVLVLLFNIIISAILSPVLLLGLHCMSNKFFNEGLLRFSSQYAVFFQPFFL